jgi:DNA replication factor Dna2
MKRKSDTGKDPVPQVKEISDDDLLKLIEEEAKTIVATDPLIEIDDSKMESGDIMVFGICKVGKDKLKVGIKIPKQWSDTPLCKHDTIRIIGDVLLSSYTTLTDKNYIILEPYYLISPTTLVDSINCSRHSLITLLAKSSEIGYPLIVGKAAHELIEEYLLREYTSPQQLDKTKKILTRTYLPDLYYLHKTMAEFEKDLTDYITHIFNISQKLLKSTLIK